MRFVFGLCLCFVCSPLWAQVSARINGPTLVKPCEIIELEVVAKGDSCLFRVTPKPKQLRERFGKNGDRCYLWLPGPHKKYEAEVTVYGIVDGKVQAESDSHTVKIEGDPPAPNPNPQPNPNPNPPTPPGPTPPPNPEPEDGRFGVCKLVYRSAKSINRPAESQALADAFSGYATKVHAEAPGTLAILTGLRTATGTAIPSESRAYWAGFNDLLSSQLRAAYGASKLQSAKDWADCFDEIARGLAAASK